MGPLTREENVVLLARCGIRCKQVRSITKKFNANAPTLFRDLKSSASQPHHACRVLGLDCLPAAVRSYGTAWTMTRDTRLLPGQQIWGLTPGFAATFWRGFSFEKIFRERLFSGIADYRRDA